MPLGAQVGLQLLLALAVITLISHGANWLVDSACRIAAKLGVSHLVIGLTVVAFGTSAPEVAASLLSGLGGHGDLAVANVVGSNIFNLCFILGSVALLLRGGLITDRALVVRDGPMLLVGTLLLYVFVGSAPWPMRLPPLPWSDFWPMPFNRRLERAEGLVLVGMFVAYLVSLYRTRLAGTTGVEALAEAEPDFEDTSFGKFTVWDVPLFLIGLATVVGGCQLLVGHGEWVGGAVHGHGALWFARVWDLPEYVVGVTIVAGGTSAPELVVSLVAARRGAFGLSAGNLIGSDLFNFYGVLGMAGLLLQRPLAYPVAVGPEMAAAMVWPCLIVLIVWLFMRTQMRVSRLEGLCLVLLGIARWAGDLGLH